MTTIAYRDGIIASDSWAVYDYDRKHTCQKLFRKRITEGKKSFDVIIATAGESSPSLLFVDWYGSGKPIPEMLVHHGGDFACLILTPKGLFEVDKMCRPEQVMDSFYAIGSGAKAALAAMHCGKSAVEAVRIAARIDPYTGGRIVHDSLQPKGALDASAKSRRK
jgi:hypothetical protein